MNLYLISQTSNYNYDTYDSAVVVAENAHDARRINPDGNENVHWSDERNSWISTHENEPFKDYSWVKATEVSVILIGEAISGSKCGVVLASYNAG